MHFIAVQRADLLAKVSKILGASQNWPIKIHYRYELVHNGGRTGDVSASR